MTKFVCLVDSCIRKTHNKENKAGFMIERTCPYAHAKTCTYLVKNLVKTLGDRVVGSS